MAKKRSQDRPSDRTVHHSVGQTERYIGSLGSTHNITWVGLRDADVTEYSV